VHWSSKGVLSVAVAIVLFAVMVPKVGSIQLNADSPSWTRVQTKAAGSHTFCDFSDAVAILALPAVVVPAFIARVHASEAHPLIRAVYDCSGHNRPPPPELVLRKIMGTERRLTPVSVPSSECC